MTFEITMGGTPYAFNFGMGFLKDINQKATSKIPNSNYVIKTGAKFVIAQVIDGDVEALADVLMLANKGETPRLTTQVLNTYIEEEADIEELFAMVTDFFGKANATKMIYKEMKGEIKAEK